MRNLAIGIILTLWLCMLCSSARAAKGPVILNVTVPPGKWKALKLRNLPKGAFVAVEVESSGEVTVAFVDTGDYQRFPYPTRPLMLGKVEKRLAFSVSIPAAGNYFVVVTNHQAREPQEVKITVSAARGGADQIEAASRILHEFERQLHRIFLFDPFPIRIEKCGVPKAFLDTSGIVLCAEYVYYLYDAVGERQRAVDALSFSIFHEVGHLLLANWNHQLSTTKEAADQFATVLMVMLNQKERVIATAKYFIENPSVSETLMKLFRDDRHPLSVERARNVLRWAKDPEFPRRWQEVLVPHMQTALLKSLQRRPTTWTNLDLVNKELAIRRHTVPESIKTSPRDISWPFPDVGFPGVGISQL